MVEHMLGNAYGDLCCFAFHELSIYFYNFLQAYRLQESEDHSAFGEGAVRCTQLCLGKITHVLPYSDILPDTLPNTIEDAIKVTIELGLSYLWVDRYCINQNNPAEVQEHVSIMDLIYNSAELTVVAAAGTDPDFGLPGIGKRDRVQLPITLIGEEWLISAAQNPTTIIQTLAWNQRGWTYQEALLSRRRLIFNELEVYYECRGMYCFETLDIPLLDIHMYGGQRIYSDLCHGVNLGIFPTQLGSTLWEVTARIQEYSLRTLTNPNDILRGFLGILQVFETGELKLGHCCGVPVFPTRPRPSKPSREWKRIWREDSESDQWSPMAGFCCGLYWDMEDAAKRRLGFPSWSWTGWDGAISWPLDESERCAFRIDPELVLRVQLDTGRSIDIETFSQLPSQERLRPSLMLHIVAWVSDVIVSAPLDDTPERPGNHRYFVTLEKRGLRPLFSRRNKPLQVLHTENVPVSNGSCIAIHMASQGRIHGPGGGPSIHLLIAQKVESASSIYERVGLSVIHETSRDLVLDNPSVIHPVLGWPTLSGTALPELVKRKQEIWIR